MSRKDLPWRSATEPEKWGTVAFGVDHVTGTFFQIYIARDEDATILYDEYSGLSTPGNVNHLPRTCQLELARVRAERQITGRRTLDEEDIVRILKSLGVAVDGNLRKEIWAMWD